MADACFCGKGFLAHFQVFSPCFNERLAFKYLGKELINIQTEELKLYYEEELCLAGIPFEIVSDELVQMCRYISLRRCGIKFGKLTSTQQTIIDDFITKYTQ